MRSETAPPGAHPDVLRGPVVWFMSVAAALGTAAIYPLQPAIADVARTLDSSVATVGLVLAGGPLGYLFGLGLLVPLIDHLPAERVLGLQFAVLAVALAVGAATSAVWVLGISMVVIGACSAVGAGLSSLAGRLASPGRRATVLGIVTAGISAGILAGRIVGGWLADAIGWQGTMLSFAASCAVVSAGSWALLPRARTSVSRGYLATLMTLPQLFVRHAGLRMAAIRGALWFFSFCAIWAGLAVALAAPPYSYSAGRIGLYALAGLSGVVATWVAGAWCDRVGARRVILVGLALAGVAAAGVGFTLSSTVATVACLALFDMGLFAAQVANQSTVLAIDPDAPARFNSAYMIVYFVGGSLGTGFGAFAVAWAGWPMTAIVSASSVALAAVLTVRQS